MPHPARMGVSGPTDAALVNFGPFRYDEWAGGWCHEGAS